MSGARSRIAAGTTAEQNLRAAVNFGLLATARALGVSPRTPILLRCECGNASCRARIEINRSDYEAAVRLGSLLVVPEHTTANPTADERCSPAVEAGSVTPRFRNPTPGPVSV